MYEKTNFAENKVTVHLFEVPVFLVSLIERLSFVLFTLMCRFVCDYGKKVNKEIIDFCKEHEKPEISKRWNENSK